MRVLLEGAVGSCVEACLGEIFLLEPREDEGVLKEGFEVSDLGCGSAGLGASEGAAGVCELERTRVRYQCPQPRPAFVGYFLAIWGLEDDF